MNLDEDPLAVPWAPECVRSASGTVAELRQRWRYVVVEEVAGGTAELHSWPWPLVDQTGRLAWLDDDDERVVVLAVPVDTLRERLYRPDLQRHPRAGDTFAAHPPTGDPDSTPDPLHALLGTEVLDISPEARHAAKLSYLGSSAAILLEDEASPDLLAAAQSAREAETAVTLHLSTEHQDGAPRPVDGPTEE